MAQPFHTGMYASHRAKRLYPAVSREVLSTAVRYYQRAGIHVNLAGTYVVPTGIYLIAGH